MVTEGEGKGLAEVLTQQTSGAEVLTAERPVARLEELLQAAFTAEAQPGAQEKFRAVVFGHAFADFDLDQLCAYYFALQTKVISLDTPVFFTPAVAPTHIARTRSDCLTIEGFSYDRADKSSPGREASSGNFANGLDNSPAAAGLLALHIRKIPTDSPAQKSKREAIKEMRKWLASVEDQSKPKSPKEHLFASIPDVLNALKYRAQQQKLDEAGEHAFLQEIATWIDALVEDIAAGTATPEHIATHLAPYAELVQEYAEFRAEQKNKLNELVRSNKQALQVVRSRSGEVIGCIDVRGSDTNEKGFETLFAVHSETTIAMLVADHVDGGQVAGSKVLLRLRDSRSDELDLQPLLVDRLNYSESVFGGGYQYVLESSYGGHPTVIGSPQREGTILLPDQLFAAVVDFFDKPRYTKEGIVAKAIELAQKLDTKTFNVSMEPTVNPYKLSTYAIHIVLDTDSSGGQLTEPQHCFITEDDLPYYEEALSGDAQYNRRVLLEQTKLSEPTAVAEVRLRTVLPELRQFAEQNMPERVLTLLEELNPVLIEQLPIQLQLQMLSGISKSPEAISLVWDQYNTRFRISDSRLPAEVRDWSETYRLNRYRLQSVASQIDMHLLRSIRKTALAQLDTQPEILVQYLSHCLDILASDAYRLTHQEKSYDSLLLQVVTTVHALFERQHPRANEHLTSLLSVYGADMQAHWQQLPAHLLESITQYSPDSRQFFAQLPQRYSEEKLLLGMPNSAVRSPDWEAIERSLSAETRQSTITVVLEVNRPVLDTLDQVAFVGMDGEPQQPPLIDGYLRTGGALHLGERYQESEIHIVLQASIEMVSDAVQQILLKNSEAKLRIVPTGFMVELAGQLFLELHAAITQIVTQATDTTGSFAEVSQRIADQVRDIENRILVSHWDKNGPQYRDKPFRQLSAS